MEIRCNGAGQNYQASRTPSRDLHGSSQTRCFSLTLNFPYFPSISGNFLLEGTVPNHQRILKEMIGNSFQTSWSSLIFTDTFTEPSRIFTDAGKSWLPIYLHRYLHGTFTDLHGCGTFENCTGRFRGREVLGIMSTSYQIPLKGVSSGNQIYSWRSKIKHKSSIVSDWLSCLWTEIPLETEHLWKLGPRLFFSKTYRDWLRLHSIEWVHVRTACLI